MKTHRYIVMVDLDFVRIDLFIDAASPEEAHRLALKQMKAEGLSDEDMSITDIIDTSAEEDDDDNNSPDT